MKSSRKIDEIRWTFTKIFISWISRKQHCKRTRQIIRYPRCKSKQHKSIFHQIRCIMHLFNFRKLLMSIIFVEHPASFFFYNFHIFFKKNLLDFAGETSQLLLDPTILIVETMCAKWRYCFGAWAFWRFYVSSTNTLSFVFTFNCNTCPWHRFSMRFNLYAIKLKVQIITI